MISVLNHCLVSVQLSWHFFWGSVSLSNTFFSSNSISSFIFFGSEKISKSYHHPTSLQNFKIHIERFDWWKSFKNSILVRRIMGGTAISQVATCEDGIKNQDQTNLGLINLSSESSGSLNLIEIATCVFVAILCLYLLSWWCQKRRARKMQQIRDALATVRVDPVMSRCPVFEPLHQRTITNQPAQPPMYPGLPKKTTAQLLGAMVMSRYE